MDKYKNQQSNYAKINHPVFWGSVILCLIFYVPMVIYQESAQGIINKLMYSVTHNLDWLWEWICFGALLFLIWMALGRYGNIKLGGPDDEPEFSYFTWVSMMFTGGVGAALVYWTVLEPIYYITAPPFWTEALSAQSAQWALAYGIFHWGFTPWAIFGVPALAFSYSFYVRKKPYLYPSYACRGVLGEMVDGWVGKAIDIFVIVGLVGGVGTSLAVCVPMISAVTAHWLGIEDTMLVKVFVAIVWASIFGYSCYRGLYSGIAKLAELNVRACIGLIIFVILVGPTFFMFSLYTDNIGMLFQNFIRMNLYTDPIQQSGFPQDWTVFYWAWWAAWAIYIGLFVTRISKGRTIKELILNMLIMGTAGCSVVYFAFGGYAVDLILNQGMPLQDILAESGGPAAIVALLDTLPFSKIVMPIFAVIMLIFQATSLDSNAYTMAMIGCHEIKDTMEPPKWSRLWWAGMLLFVTLALMLVGGLKVVQLSSVLTSVPVLFILIILTLSVLKWLKEDFGEQCRPKLLVIDYKENSKSKMKSINQVSDKANI